MYVYIYTYIHIYIYIYIHIYIYMWKKLSPGSTTSRSGTFSDPAKSSS